MDGNVKKSKTVSAKKEQSPANEHENCFCGGEVDPAVFMVECTSCEKWFHGHCVNLSEEEAFNSIQPFLCPKCSKGNKTQNFGYLPASLHAGGSSHPKEPVNPPPPLPNQFANLSISEINSIVLLNNGRTSKIPTKLATTYNHALMKEKNSPQFRRLVLGGMYAKSGVRYLKQQDMTSNLLRRNGFQEPIVVQDSNQVKLKSKKVRISDIEKNIPPKHMVKLLDITSQTTSQMTRLDWSMKATLQKTNAVEGSNPVNIEFLVAGTEFQQEIKAPQVMTDIDWATPFNDSDNIKMEIDKHGDDDIMVTSSISGFLFDNDTYKDFHLLNDNMGQSSWLNLVSGKLALLLIPPSLVNLKKYREWTTGNSVSPNASPQKPKNTSFSKNDIFFADFVAKCIKIDLNANSILYLPSGWMIAMLSMDQSLFFTGFCQNSLNLNTQLVYYDLFPDEMSKNIQFMLNGIRKYRHFLPSYPVKNENTMLLDQPKDDIKKCASKLENIFTDWEFFTWSKFVPFLHSFLQKDKRKVYCSPVLLRQVNIFCEIMTKNYQNFPNSNPAYTVACKCHLKKCPQCRNCIKRHCQCQSGSNNKLVNNINPMMDISNTIKATNNSGIPLTSGSNGNSTVCQLYKKDNFEDDLNSCFIYDSNMVFKEEKVEEDSFSSIWDVDESDVKNANDVSFLGDNSLILSMDGILDDSLNSIHNQSHTNLAANSFLKLSNSNNNGNNSSSNSITSKSTNKDVMMMMIKKEEEDLHEEKKKQEEEDIKRISAASSSHSASLLLQQSEELMNDGNMLIINGNKHRASCHRCGNLRKKNIRCLNCPHIFCQKCAEKMINEHGEVAFLDGCPLCKELCCCGKNRSNGCQRKFHCYKKCPSTKRIAGGSSASSCSSPPPEISLLMANEEDDELPSSILSNSSSSTTSTSATNAMSDFVTWEEPSKPLLFTNDNVEDHLFQTLSDLDGCNEVNNLDVPTSLNDIDVDFDLDHLS